MSKIQYFLRKKSKNSIVMSEAEELKNNANKIINQISNLGYPPNVVNEISTLLKGKYSHDKFVDETNEKETILLVSHTANWKPTFNLAHGYDNLVDMEKWYRRKEHMYEIVYENRGKKQILSWEDFIKKVQNYKYEGFGMPKKYNQKEETIWDWLR